MLNFNYVFLENPLDFCVAIGMTDAVSRDAREWLPTPYLNISVSDETSRIRSGLIPNRVESNRRSTRLINSYSRD